MKTVVFYATTDNKYRICDIDTMMVSTISKFPKDMKHFYMLKGYDTTRSGLKTFASDFKTWIEELDNEGIDYLKGDTHNSTVIKTLRKFITWKRIKDMPIPDKDEVDWISKCNNGGIFQCTDSNEVHDATTYDFESYYPTMMGKTGFLFPSKSGKTVTFDSIPDNLRENCGYYRIKIQSIHPDARFYVGFSKSNVYCSNQLSLFRKLENDGLITMELIKDGKPNAYIYKKEDMVRSTDYFYGWYDYLIDLKRKQIGGKLTKHLLSSLYGSLTKMNTYIMSFDEYIESGPEVRQVSVHRFDGGTPLDMLVYDVGKCTCSALFRIKAFLMGCTKRKIGFLAYDNKDNLLRVACDSITLDKPLQKLPKTLKLDESKTGKIRFGTHNSIVKLD